MSLLSVITKDDPTKDFYSSNLRARFSLRFYLFILVKCIFVVLRIITPISRGWGTRVHLSFRFKWYVIHGYTAGFWFSIFFPQWNTMKFFVSGHKTRRVIRSVLQTFWGKHAFAALGNSSDIKRVTRVKKLFMWVRSELLSIQDFKI